MTRQYAAQTVWARGCPCVTCEDRQARVATSTGGWRKPTRATGMMRISEPLPLSDSNVPPAVAAGQPAFTRSSAARVVAPMSKRGPGL